MPANENNFSIKGVVYAKPVRVVENKKKPTEPPYEFRSIILEVKTSYSQKSETGGEAYRTKTSLPEFQLSRGMNIDEFDISDFIEVRFSLDGKKVNSNWHKTELRATYIKHADLDSNQPRKSNKVDTPAMSDPKELKKETVFVTPDSDNDGNEPLPF